MSDSSNTLAYEENLADWWRSHVLVSGGTAERTDRLCWSLDKVGGGSGMHRVRLTDQDFETEVSRRLDEAAPFGSAVWAYVSDCATPDDAILRFRAAGFQHTKRFDVFIHPLAGIKAPALPSVMTIERLSGLDRFDKQVPHPYFGPITTRLRRMAAAGEARLIESRPDDFFSWLLSVDGVPTSSVTVLITNTMAGIYNVGTIEAARGHGYAGILLTHALRQARQAGARKAGLIAVARAEPLYERVGFAPDGWISLLYYSKTKMQKRAAR